MEIHGLHRSALLVQIGGGWTHSHYIQRLSGSSIQCFLYVVVFYIPLNMRYCGLRTCISVLIKYLDITCNICICLWTNSKLVFQDLPTDHNATYQDASQISRTIMFTLSISLGCMLKVLWHSLVGLKRKFKHSGKTHNKCFILVWIWLSYQCVRSLINDLGQIC